MTTTKHFTSRCIIVSEGDLNEEELFSQYPEQLGCQGRPPADLLLCYPLCLDCDLLHNQHDRSLFSRLALYVSEAQSVAADRYASLDLGYAAMRKMLERLSLGDPDARVVLPDDVGVFRELEPLLNNMAAYLRDQVDDSHEVAIGLCEHYETLLQLAGGELTSRASESSPVELIAKLGELINRQAERFCDTITALNNKEQELLALSRLQRGIIDFLPDATFVIDRTHRVIAWNKAMVALTGTAESELLGKGDYAYAEAFYGTKRPLLIDFIGTDLTEARNYYKKIEQRGKTLIAEGCVPFSSQGSNRELWITASPLFDGAGAVIGAIESVRDITELRHAEAERELLKDQLHHAQKLDSIGQLAGGIAHEFNNILAAILGYAGILEPRMEKGSANHAAVHRIITASEKAASLTRSMLTFSRKQAVALELLPLNSYLAGMREMLTRLAGENIHVCYQLDPGDLLVRADMGQLQQIVLNLYNNARDAMPQGGDLLICTSSCQLLGQEEPAPPGIPPGRYVCMAVSDTGCGIAPEMQHMIFDPFFTTKDIGKGTGLGLSMVFGIIQQHHGYITVDSSSGEGSTFTVWLPEYDAAQHGEAEHVPEEREPVMKGVETILIGEDNEDVRPMIVELLQDLGYQVLEGRNGAEVVELMQDFGDTVDLLLMDVVMPRMNGYEALSLVRERYPHVPCVFLSGYSDDVLKQKAKITGEFTYLTKPIMPDTLIATVQAALAGTVAQ